MNRNNITFCQDEDFDIRAPVTAGSDPWQRLPYYRRATQTFWRWNGEMGPFQNETDYRTRALVEVSRRVRRYSVTGHPCTELVVLEDHRSDYDRLWEYLMGSRTQISDEWRLFCHPMHAAEILDLLPDSRLISALTLLNDRNWMDRYVEWLYHQQFGSDKKPFGSSAARMQATHEVVFFRRRLGGPLRWFLWDDLSHEYGHEQDEANADLKAAFIEAMAAEDDNGFGWLPTKWLYCYDTEKRVLFKNNDYCLTCPAEHYGCFGQNMLDRLGFVFVNAVRMAPLRAFVWAVALERTLLKAQLEGHTCLYKEQYMDRVAYARAMVTSEARAKVEKGGALHRLLQEVEAEHLQHVA